MRILAFAALSTLVATLAAQTPPPAAPKTEAELDQQVAQLLVAFARTADGAKMPAQARLAWEQVLDHYDVENPAARTGMGWKKLKGEWQPGDDAKLPPDSGSPAQRKQIADAWTTVRKKAATLHRGLGERLFAAGEMARAQAQFERVLWFEPNDAKAHEALGHQAFEGFYGTAEQVALARRLREILAKANELATNEIAIEALAPSFMPKELKASGLEFQGARGQHLTWWALDQEAAVNCVRWAERGLQLLDWLYPDGPRSRGSLDPNHVKWVVMVRTPEDRDRLLAGDQALLAGSSLSMAKVGGGAAFQSASGRAEWMIARNAELDGDRAVGLVAKRCVMVQGAGSEGLVHAMTWLLCGSLHTSYWVPATVAGGSDDWQSDPTEWLTKLRNLVAKGADMPIAQAACEKLERFRDPVRAKMWTFVLYVLARHPDRWSSLLSGLSKDNPAEAAMVEAIETALDRQVADIELEWREWVRSGSRLGSVSGLPK